MTGRHRSLWGPAAIQRDLGSASGGAKHKAPHVHTWQCVAEFKDRGFALFQCAGCEETRTLWQSEIEVLQQLEAQEWGAPWPA